MVAPEHPTYKVMIKAAILGLKDHSAGRGSAFGDIVRFIRDRYTLDQYTTVNVKKAVSTQLKNLAESGHLRTGDVCLGNRYKLTAMDWEEESNTKRIDLTDIDDSPPPAKVATRGAGAIHCNGVKDKPAFVHAGTFEVRACHSLQRDDRTPART
jgi:hypothetical protein